jgi:prenyltransferase beta subunit
MTYPEIIQWLLQGDVSIQYQVYRDLLGEESLDLKNRIETEGWGKQFLEKRNENAHWGKSFYQPKWTSTHYTLLDLRNLEISNNCKPIQETVELILKENKVDDGGIHPIGTTKNSDLCINGMALNYCSYFMANEKDLESVVDFIISHQMKDGGFNCRINRSGAKHSSLHTTISVVEGIREYDKNKYTYRLKELLQVE